MVKRIFVISQPQVIDTVGGAITVFTDFCNILADNGYDVTGMCFTDKKGQPKKLQENVKFVNLRYYNNSKTFSEGLNAYGKKYHPDLFVFFFPNYYREACLLPEFDSIPRILMFHSRPDAYILYGENYEKLKPFYKNTIAQILFPSYFDILPDFIRKDKVVCIPNWIKLPGKSVNNDIEHKKIVYLSRVDKYKGLEFLIDSYALIARKYPDWTLDIYGQSEPPEYIEKLQKRINKKHLENSIFFKGITNSPKDTLLEYDFCVFPSYFEGFPLGLSDALSVGLPAIGLKACSGVNELIIDGETGLLADFNKKDYASKISYLIEQKDLRKRMSENAVQSMKRYDKSLVLKIWLDLINDIFNHTEKVPETNSSICKYKIFPIKKISKVDRVNKWFSIRRDLNKTKIYLLGIKFSIKNKKRKEYKK